MLAIVIAIAVPSSRARGANPPSPPNLTLPRIVAGIVSHNQTQNQNLRQYRALRTYNVTYRGLGTLSANMQVEVTYTAGRGETFQVVSQSGSFLLRDAVLKRAVKSEEEASKERNEFALSPANYRFRLLGKGMVGGRSVYILRVDPLKPGKFLYRGTIWVDAANFGVVKIQAAPAKNPSFWISRTTILVTDECANGFWLPQKTHSQTTVRLGGTATLNIDYGQYHIQGSAPTTAQVALPGNHPQDANRP